MKKYLPLLLLSLLNTSLCIGNDGAFYAKGNQLIPMRETDISVKKEILCLKKIDNKYIEVSVYYEFFNPKEEKQLTIGFEAFSPDGDVDGTPKNGQHPYIRDFTVAVNNKILNYNIAYVTDSTYNKKGTIASIDLAKFNGSKSGNSVDFFYVYHFNVNFKKGSNIIKHTYNYDLSGSVGYHYYFEYVLTAAKRWANKQIDDFTLLIDMGEFETYSINKSFFKSHRDWQLSGIGKWEEIKGNPNTFIENDALKFHMQKGYLIFQQKNFKVDGDLFLYAQNYINNQNLNYIPFSYYQESHITDAQNALQRKILYNLPFARRGYIFQNKELNDYFNNLDWYIANPNYLPNKEMLTIREQQWLEKWQ